MMRCVDQLRRDLLHRMGFRDAYPKETPGGFSFIGVHEKWTRVDWIALVEADGLTELDVHKRCDLFFEITQRYPPYGLRRSLSPWGLMCFLFEEEVSNGIVTHIRNQSRINHTLSGNSVVVSWSLNVRRAVLTTHDNPVSEFPPVRIRPEGTFAWTAVYPPASYFRRFLRTFREIARRERQKAIQEAENPADRFPEQQSQVGHVKASWNVPTGPPRRAVKREVDALILSYLRPENGAPSVFQHLSPDNRIFLKEFISAVGKRMQDEVHEGDFSVSSLARAASIGERQFRRRIEKHTRGAFSPRRLITRIRIEKAKALLEQGESVTQTAFGVGWSPSYFTKVFSDWTGENPSAYRARFREA